MTPKEFEVIDKMYRVMSMLVLQYKKDNSGTQNHSTVSKEWKEVEDSVRELRETLAPTKDYNQVKRLSELIEESFLVRKKALESARDDMTEAERLFK